MGRDSAPVDDVAAAHAQLARDVRLALRGETQALAACFASEHDDVQRVRRRREASLQRVSAARHHAMAPLRLQDGSAWPLEKADKALAEKEESRTFAALRELVDDHLREGRATDDARALLDGDDAIVVVSDDEKKLITSLHDALRPLVPAAKDIVASIGRVPWRGDDVSVARALSLPVPLGAFSDEAALALLKRSKEILRPVLVHDATAMRVPPALTPFLLTTNDASDDGANDASHHPMSSCFGVARCVRADAHASLLLQGERALSRALATEKPESLAVALSLSLQTVDARRSVLDEERGRARDAAKVLAATATLLLACEAALFLAFVDDGDNHEALSESLVRVIDTPLPSLIDAFLAPTIDARPHTIAGRSLDTLTSFVDGCGHARMLRDALDDAFAIVPGMRDAWREDVPARDVAHVVDVLGERLS